MATKAGQMNDFGDLEAPLVGDEKGSDGPVPTKNALNAVSESGANDLVVLDVMTMLLGPVTLSRAQSHPPTILPRSRPKIDRVFPFVW